MIRVMGGLLSPLTASSSSLSVSMESLGSTPEKDLLATTSTISCPNGSSTLLEEPLCSSSSSTYPAAHDPHDFSTLPELEDTDDEDSIGSVPSSASLESFTVRPSVAEEDSRRVSFVEPLVTRVWTRPRTDPRDVRGLFYSQEETQQYVFKNDFFIAQVSLILIDFWV